MHFIHVLYVFQDLFFCFFLFSLFSYLLLCFVCWVCSFIKQLYKYQNWFECEVIFLKSLYNFNIFKNYFLLTLRSFFSFQQNHLLIWCPHLYETGIIIKFIVVFRELKSIYIMVEVLLNIRLIISWIVMVREYLLQIANETYYV